MNTGEQKKFSHLLKKFRENAGISINRLGRLAEINPTHISRLEKTYLKISPNKRTVIALANALELSEDNTIKLLKSAGYENTEIQKSKILTKQHKAYTNNQLEHPTLLLIRDILFDTSLTLNKRKQIATEIEKYARYLHSEAKR